MSHFARARQLDPLLRVVLVDMSRVLSSFTLLPVSLVLATLAFPGCSLGGGGGDDDATAGSTSASDTRGSTGPDGTADGTADDASSGGEFSVMLEGRAEKGPLILGSSVRASPLDASGLPTGESYDSVTSSDLGSFELLLPLGLVAFEVDGFFYDEIGGTLSTSPIQLRGSTVLDMGTAEAYVNVLTHLRHQRLLALVAMGTDHAAAVTQSTQDVLTALPVGAATPMGITFEDVSILGGDSMDEAYLLAVSAVLLQAAYVAAGGESAAVAGQLQVVLNTLSADLAEDGLLDADSVEMLEEAESLVDEQLVLDNLGDYATSLGAPWAPPPLGAVLDRDHDGVVNDDDNCPGVANPGQEDADDDGMGDACSDCTDPSLPNSDTDSIPDLCDNCPDDGNGDQFDPDGDGVGSVCDLCPAIPGDEGVVCCDPLDAEAHCATADLDTSIPVCLWSEDHFECSGNSVTGNPYTHRCPCGGEGVCVSPGVMPAHTEFDLTGCVGGSCCTKYCSLAVGNCGAPGLEAVPQCIPFFEVGTAPPGTEDLGLCVDTSAGPCSVPDAYAVGCAF